MSTIKKIQPKIHDMSNGLFANWMPNTKIDIGDFGILQRSAFERQGALTQYGVAFEVEESEGKDNQLGYQNFVKVDMGAEVSAADKLSGVEASVTLEFSNQGAFLFHLSGINQVRLKNLKSFYEDMGAAILSGDVTLDKEGVVVTEVQVAKKATIIVLDGKSGSINLNTNFKPVGKAFLSGAKGSVKTVTETGSLMKWIGGDDTIALLKMVRPTFSLGPNGPNIGQPIAKWVREFVGGRPLHIDDFPLKRYIEPTPDSVTESNEDHQLIFGVAGTDFEISMRIVEVSVDDIVAQDEVVFSLDFDEKGDSINLSTNFKSVGEVPLSRATWPDESNVGRPIAKWVKGFVKRKPMHVAGSSLKQHTQATTDSVTESNEDHQLIFGVAGTDFGISMRIVEVSVDDIVAQDEVVFSLDFDENGLEVKEAATQLRTKTIED